MNAITILDTGFGQWQPLVWLVSFVILIVIAAIIRSFGNKNYQESSEQTQPFLSGCDEPDVNKVHIRASNLYWGFTETLKSYYDKIIAIHTGVTSDYLLWFFGVMAITLVLGLVL